MELSIMIWDEVSLEWNLLKQMPEGGPDMDLFEVYKFEVKKGVLTIWLSFNTKELMKLCRACLINCQNKPV